MIKGLYEADLAYIVARLHIGDDSAQLSYPTIGELNCATDSLTRTENSVRIDYKINEIPASIEISAKDGELSGKSVVQLAEMNCSFVPKKLSDDASIGEFHRVIPETNLAALRKYSSYDDCDCASVLTYELGSEAVLERLRNEGITADSLDGFAKVKELTRKVSSLIRQDGANFTHDREHRGTIAQLDYALAQGAVTNCRGLAIILAGVLRANGFRSGFVNCLPFDENDIELHVVCEVYVDELSRAVMIDPSAGAYYTQGGKPLSLLGLRDALASGKSDEIELVKLCADKENERVQMLAYMSKNLAILERCLHSGEDFETDIGNSLCLLPLGLEPGKQAKDSRVTYNRREFEIR